MSTEAIVAIVAAAIALAALFYNWRSAAAASRSAAAAADQVAIARQVQIDAAQPYVWADIRPDPATGTLLNLVVGNSGPTVAQDVRISFNPSLQAIPELQHRANTAEQLLNGGLKSLPPGRVYTWPLGQGSNLVGKDLSNSYRVRIEAMGPFGPVPPLEYVVDLGALRGALDRPDGSLHQLSLAVKGVEKAVARIRENSESASPVSRSAGDEELRSGRSAEE